MDLRLSGSLHQAPFRFLCSASVPLKLLNAVAFAVSSNILLSAKLLEAGVDLLGDPLPPAALGSQDHSSQGPWWQSPVPSNCPSNQLLLSR